MVPMLVSFPTGGAVNSLQNTQNTTLNQSQYGILTLSDVSKYLAFSNDKDSVLSEHANKIDSYFAKYDLPLEGTGMKMVLASEKYNIDWRILPAIAMRESTGGKFACKTKENNPFGWASCRVGFKTIDDSIDTIAKNISGNHGKTSSYYKDLPLKDMLENYNGRAVPRYAQAVMSIMDDIASIEINQDLAFAGKIDVF